jgi:hypothetical protein
MWCHGDVMTLVAAATFENSLEAGMARARLEAEGIPSFLFGMDMNPVFAGGIFNIKLMVDEEDLDAVRQILSAEGEQGSD